MDLPITTPTQPVYSDRLRAGASGVSFFDVTYTDLAAVPSLLSHQLFVNLDEHGLMDHTALTTPIAVSCRDPVVLSPPLVGSGSTLTVAARSSTATGLNERPAATRICRVGRSGREPAL